MQKVRDYSQSAQATEQRSGGILSPAHRQLTIGLVSLAVLIAFEATAVATAMPAAARSLDGLSLYAFAFSAYFTTSLVSMVISGHWCDRRGPLAPLTAGLVCFAAGLFLGGAAPAMWAFLLGRALQGLGGGLIIVAMYVVVSRAYPERLRPAIMASFSAAWVVPGMIGPLIAGFITEHFGWRWVFLAVPTVMLPALCLALPSVRRLASGPTDDSGTAQGPRRIRLALVVSAGAALLQYAGQKLDLYSLLPATLGAALLIPAILHLMPRGTFRVARGIPAIVLLRGLAGGSFIAAESFIPLMLVSQRGMSLILAGLSLAGGGLTWAIGSYVQSRPSLENHRERLCQFGMVLVGAGIATAALPLLSAVPVWATAAAWCVGGFGMGMVIPSLSVLLMEHSSPTEVGGNSAALQVGDNLSNALLLAACGAAFAMVGGPTTDGSTEISIPSEAFLTVFLPLSLIAFAGVIVASRFGSRRTAVSPAA